MAGRAGVDARVPKVPKGGYFPHPTPDLPGGGVQGGGVVAVCWRGVAGTELEGEPRPPRLALKRASLLPRSSISPLPAPESPCSPRPLHSPPLLTSPSTPSGPTTPSRAGFPDLPSHSYLL